MDDTQNVVADGAASKYSLNLDKTYKYKSHTIKWTSFGTGPPLIFIHGTPWSSELWYPIARCFAKTYTVYLFDLVGYGSGAHATYDWSSLSSLYPLQTEAFCSLLEHWRTQSDDADFQPHVVAHDIGGHVALRAILEHGASIASLLLVDCGAAFPVDESFFSLVGENTSVFVDLPPYLHEALVREYIRGASHKGLRKDQEDLLVRPWLSGQGQRAFYELLKAQKNEDVEALMRLYKPLSIPVHIVWAKEDSWVPVDRAAKLQAAVGGALKVIENAGHLIQMDAPEELLMEISQWLDRIQKVKR